MCAQRRGLGLGVPSRSTVCISPWSPPQCPYQEVTRETAATKRTQRGKKTDSSLDAEVRGCPGDPTSTPHFPRTQNALVLLSGWCPLQLSIPPFTPQTMGRGQRSAFLSR